MARPPEHLTFCKKEKGEKNMNTEGSRWKGITVILVIMMGVSVLSAVLPVQARADLEVVCVPWKGNENLPHPTCVNVA